MSAPAPGRCLARYAAVWAVLAAWAVVCAWLGVPGASGWVVPCTVAGGTLAVLAAVLDHRGRQ